MEHYRRIDGIPPDSRLSFSGLRAKMLSARFGETEPPREF
jgi:hypothetical protein